MSAPTIRAAWLATLLLGCTGGEPATIDGGVDAALAPPVYEVAAPAPPQLGCPAGWSTRTLHAATGLEGCEPWPLGTDPRCPPGEARFVGESACAPVGPACPADGWPAGLPSTGVIFVDDSAPAGGDGSARGSALQALADAVAAAGAGDVVAVAAGEYTIDALRVPAGVTVRGACVAAVQLRSSTASTSAMVELLGAGAALEQVTLESTARPALAVTGAASGSVRAVEVSGAEGIGVWVSGGTLSATRLSVRDVQPIADGRFGQGVVVELGGTLTASEVSVLDCTEHGLVVQDARTTAEVSEVVIMGTRARPADDLGGIGVAVRDGAVATVREALVEDNVRASLFVDGSGSALTVEDAVVRATQPAPPTSSARQGRGLGVEAGGHAILRRVVLERHYDVGVQASAGSTVEAEDLAITDIEPDVTDGSNGYGVFTYGGASVRVTRGLIARTVLAGISTEDAGTLVELTDVAIRDIRARADGRGGRGLMALIGGEARATRLHVEGCPDIGVAVTDGSSATLTDLRVRDIAGRGVEVNRGSQATLASASIEEIETMGLMASATDTRVTVENLSFEGTTMANPEFGRALQVQRGAVVEGRGLRIQNHRELGMLAVADARIHLDAVEIRSILPRGCAEDSCAGLGFGYGAVAFLGGRVELQDFTIESCALAGVVIGEGGAGSFVNGRIAGQPIGVNLREDVLSFDETFMDVAFDDNERNVDAETLPLPEPGLDEG